jgi:hypothetical protein
MKENWQRAKLYAKMIFVIATNASENVMFSLGQADQLTPESPPGE